MTDTIVVGAGIVGLSVADHLARAGQSVTVVDRDPVGTGASGGNAGLISLGHPPLTVPGASWQGLKWMASPTAPFHVRPRLDLDLLRWLWSFHFHCDADWATGCQKLMGPLGRRSMELFEEGIDRDGIDCDFARTGWLDVCLDPNNLAAARDEARDLARFGFSHMHLDRDALLERDPAFRSDVAGAILYPDSACCDPGAYVRGLAAATTRRGTTVRTGTAVDALDLVGSEVRGVKLASGETLHAHSTVLAAGIWTTELARQIALPIPMQPARGYNLQLEGLPVLPSTGSVLHETFVVATPMYGNLRLAGTLEIAPVGRPWSRNRLAMLRRGARRYLRGVDAAVTTAEWAGYRPCTADGLPVMGPVPTRPGLFVATGHAMQGLTLGPASGEFVGDLILGRTPRIDPELMRVDRF